MTESWPIHLSEDLELIRQKISDLPVDKKKDLYVALQYDEKKDMHAWVNNELLRYTKEMWPLMCGVTRSDKVWFVKEWDRIPVYVIK